jgi:hypothetical protein
MKKSKRIFYILLFTILSLLGCKKDKNLFDSLDYSKIVIIPDAKTYNKLLKDRSNYKGIAPFEIIGIKKEGFIYKITVEGGCNTLAYKIYWDERMDIIKGPLTANLIISYESEIAIKCSKAKVYTMEVDLLPMMSRPYNPKMNVKISNSSKVADSLIDKDGLVTLLQ